MVLYLKEIISFSMLQNAANCDVNKYNCKISDMQNNKIYNILTGIKVLLNSVQFSVTDSKT